jgi:hypothetical protein
MAEPDPETMKSDVAAEERELALAGLKVDTVTGVISTLEKIEAVAAATTRGPDDGVACFTRLYTTITKAVLAAIKNDIFEDEEFITQLDLTFAQRYFSALGQVTTPHCWTVLLNRRQAPGIHPIAFAVSGVNAHVNFDLPIAVVATCRTLNMSMTVSEHAAYQQINQIFKKEMKGLVREFAGGVLEAAVERPADEREIDLIGDHLVVIDRNLAWVHAERLYQLQGPRAESYQRWLDRFTALASRAVLASH